MQTTRSLADPPGRQLKIVLDATVGGGIETKETGRSAEAWSRLSALTQFLTDWETKLAQLG